MNTRGKCYYCPWLNRCSNERMDEINNKKELDDCRLRNADKIDLIWLLSNKGCFTFKQIEVIKETMRKVFKENS